VLVGVAVGVIYRLGVPVRWFPAADFSLVLSGVAQ
jgi:hypothetical protein